MRREEMGKSKNRIPDEILKEIFPKKLKRSLASERAYNQLKQMILSGKLRKGKRLYREKIAQDLDVSYTAVCEAFSRLKKDGLVIVKRTAGSFVA
jgi:DNA-binding GntR family transcriptional regulator